MKTDLVTDIKEALTHFSVRLEYDRKQAKEDKCSKFHKKVKGLIAKLENYNQ
jgi:predicted site-specific integrase-resolvase